MNLNRIFTSHMVFSAHNPIRIYGEGEGSVKVTFAGFERMALSNGGKWLLEFPAMSYGGPYTLTAYFDDRTVALDDIYIGEVILFAGQSNMQFKMSETELPLDDFEINDKLRLYSTDRLEDTDHFKATDGWLVCKKDEIKHWSAIAFLTSHEIARNKNIAVGAIACYQGASVIESWVPRETFQKIGINIPIEKKYIDHTHEEYGRWNHDGQLYEFALSQVIPFALSAVVWYQGESDTSIDEAKVYGEELKELVRIWRKDFKNSKLPFVVIQIADYDARAGEAWSLVQKAQLEIQETEENVKTVISADVCETDDIHPKTKDKLSGRVAVAIEEALNK